MYTIIVTVARLPSHLSRVQLKKVGGGDARQHIRFSRGVPKSKRTMGKKN